MKYYSYRGPEPSSDLPPEERPNFQDLEQHAEAGIVKRGIARYLFSRNPERSIKVHTCLGAPVVRAVLMGTYGRLIPRSGGSNYRTDPSKSRLEAATRFAVGGSVFNEAVHTALVAWNTEILVNDISDGHNFTVSAIATGVNAALVSLQRYNRARMVVRVNEELEAGATYRDTYENYLGIDHRAAVNYEATLAKIKPDGDIPPSNDDVACGTFSLPSEPYA
ncbi:MAG: hypothetical protein JWN38_883 [Candidatus Saccharibacteria bacterium]|nr:hypothetical protein [Candidatus Saccharibacteria bacterium]